MQPFFKISVSYILLIERQTWIIYLDDVLNHTIVSNLTKLKKLIKFETKVLEQTLRLCHYSICVTLITSRQSDTVKLFQ
jgi:hypothetical protein